MNTTRYIVRLSNDGEISYMRATAWTWDRNRATIFDTPNDAQIALERARQFMKPKLYKQAVIVEIVIA